MKSVFYPLLFGMLMVSCHQKTWEEKCLQEAEEYTRTHCPWDFGNGVKLDSLTYQAASNTNTYYYTVSGDSDQDSLFHSMEDEMRNDLLNQIRNSIELKEKKDHRTRLNYVYKSACTGKILLNTTFEVDESVGMYKEVE